jgi:hypothetical protein
MADVIDIYDPLVQDQKILNEVKFSARDFVSIADDLLRRLKIEYGEVYNDYASTSQGMMLRDLVAWAYAALSWYLDRTASDCFLATARTRSAVQRLVEQIAYKMGPATSAGTQLVLTFPDGTISAFTMKDRWKYTGPNGLIFESYAKKEVTAAIAAGGTITVDVRQGETKISTYTSDGSKNQMYRLTSIGEDQYVGIGTVEVWVDGQVWTEEDFLEFEKTNHFEVSYLSDPPIVRFGDGIAGNIPPAGAEVKIRYLIIDGELGNVLSDTIVTSVDTLYVAGEQVSFTVTNPVRATGGGEPESIDSAKKYAPVSFAARGSAITQIDYNALANSFRDPVYGAVAKAYAMNPRTPYEDKIFNDAKDSIVNDLVDYVANIQTDYATISAYSALIDPLIDAVDAAAGLIDSSREDMVGYVGSAITGAGTAKSSLTETQSKCDAAYSLAIISVQSVTNLRDSILAGSVTTDEIVEGLDIILSNLGSIKIDTHGASSSASTASTAIDNSVTPNLNNINSAVSTAGDIYTQSQAIPVYNQSITSYLVYIQSGVDGIYDDAVVLQTAINVDLETIDDHMEIILTDDCMNNYVQVPILATDLEGNYTSPSLGLKAALQTELDSIKEVTQIVDVIDGSSILVPADIAIIISVSDGYVFSEIESQVISNVTRLLKGRDFDSPLYLSDVYGIIKSIVGIYYVNVTISSSSYSGLIDSKGNLITEKNQVVVKGSLSVVAA